MSGVSDPMGPAPEFLRAVDAVDWVAYGLSPCPLGYRAERPPRAFRRLVAVSNQAEAATAYGEMLFAVGNNHAGVLYPAAVPAAPLLATIVRERSGWARWAASETLIEFLSFDADRDEFTDPGGRPVRTKDAILAAVLEIHDDLEALAARRPTGRRSPVVAPIADSAADLLEALNDETAGR
jgi:hypothetical protein